MLFDFLERQFNVTIVLKGADTFVYCRVWRVRADSYLLALPHLLKHLQQLWPA